MIYQFYKLEQIDQNVDQLKADIIVMIGNTQCTTRLLFFIMLIFKNYE